MLQNKFLQTISAILLFAISFTACKKDAFSEKDAIAAQTTLLQTKFNFDLAIKNIDLQIQRVSDSAKIAMIGIQRGADSAVERVKQSAQIAQLLQQLQNARLLALQADSLQRGIATLNDQVARASRLFNDSVTLAANNLSSSTNILNALRKNYSITLTDFNTGAGISGATVSVIPFGTTTAISATTNTSGTATFTNQIVDPGAFFSASATGYASILIREFNLVTIGSVPSTTTPNATTTVRGNSSSLQMFNSASTRNTIRGSMLGDLDLTNGDAVEAIVGNLVTFTQTVNTGSPAISVTYQFPAVSDVNGNFSVGVPDGFYTPVYSNNVRVQQRLFVNAFTDEDASIAVPRIATVGATLTNSFFSTVSAGTGTGYYYSLPADTISGRTVIAAVTTNGQNTFLQPNTFSNFPYANRNLGSVKTDSLQNNFFASSFNLTFNNATGTHSSDNSVGYTRRNLYLVPPTPRADTLTVTLVSLVPNWIVASPALRAIVDGTTGKVNQIRLAQTNVAVGNIPSWQTTPGAGGIFNNAFMFTPSGRQAWTNLTMNSQTYLPSLANIVNQNGINNVNAFNVNGGNSYFMAIEFRNTIARDRTPR